MQLKILGELLYIYFCVVVVVRGGGGEGKCCKITLCHFAINNSIKCVMKCKLNYKIKEIMK